jgi:hypothetical protein
MKPVSRPPRTPSQLPVSLDHLVNLYALAAAGESAQHRFDMRGLVARAVALGALALPHLADARIVYTKAHRVVGFSTSVQLIFRNEPEFTLWNNATDNGFTYEVLVIAPLKQGNGAVGKTSHGVPFASALRRGSRIGSNRAFLSGSACLVRGHPSSIYGGPWVNVKNRYLGLKFRINGHVHYGWARMSVSAGNGKGIGALLTGYAYETISNKPIIAGKTKGTDDGMIDPLTLGRLALGRR